MGNTLAHDHNALHETINHYFSNQNFKKGGKPWQCGPCVIHIHLNNLFGKGEGEKNKFFPFFQISL